MEYSNGFHTMMYAIWELLDKVDMKYDRISMNAIKLGKLIKRQSIKSKHTLNQKEIHYYTISLREIYKNWAMKGHPDWSVKEKDMSATFTIIFERKEFKDRGKGC